MNRHHTRQVRSVRQKGFTLLLAALVASIVLAMGAAIYSIAVKSLNLSAVGRDSQFAFYAADTASECALYWDINRNAFATSSPPSNISCDNASSTVNTFNVVSAPSGPTSWVKTLPGTYTFTPGVDTPASFGTITVIVLGGGGGGGGGATISGLKGGNAGDGSASRFGATVIGNGGGHGSGQLSSGGTGTTGSAGTGSGGDSSITGGGGPGGTGGTGFDNALPGVSGVGGTGGGGGRTVKTYASLPSGVPITVIVGAGGSSGPGGAPSGQPGSLGFNGSVSITWTGGSTPSWTSTTFSFQTEPNGVCSTVYLTKSIVSGGLRNLIHADGYNVPCSATTTSPRALQRSVELNY